MVQEIGLVLKQLRSLVLHGRLQRLSIGTGNAIPRLGFAPAIKQDIITILQGTYIGTGNTDNFGYNETIEQGKLIIKQE